MASRPKKPRGFIRKIKVKTYQQTRDVRKLTARGPAGRFRKRKSRKPPKAPRMRQIKLF